MLARKDFHVFSRHGQDYLFLPVPVAAFKIDPHTAEVLRSLEKGETLTDEFAEQRAEEALAFIENYTKKAPVARVMRAPEDIDETVSGIYLFTSQKCNLKCAYCYGDEGEYGRRGVMSEAVLDTTFDTFFADSGKRNFITFFGGEPLMNLPVMECAAERADAYRAEGKGDVSFGIVTNGTLYSTRIKKFFDRYISSVTFSLDGPKEWNDGQRFSKSGTSAYERATKNIRKLTKDARFTWAFRTIVTSRSADHVDEIYDHLNEFGPGGIGIVNVDVPKEDPLYLSDEQYERFVEQILSINRKGLQTFIEGDQGVAFEYPFYVLFYLISRTHALYHCNAGTNLLAVTAEGDVYPCHRFVGTEEFRMGNVSDPKMRESARYRELRQRFVDSTVDNRAGCKECWARYLCGGCCAKYSHAAHGDINPPVERHCYYIKKVIEELVPEVLRVIETPEEKSALMHRLRAAVSNRFGSKGVDARVS